MRNDGFVQKVEGLFVFLESSYKEKQQLWSSDGSECVVPETP